MAPFISNTDTVQTDDIAGVQAIYGNIPLAQLTSATTVQLSGGVPFTYQITATNQPTNFSASFPTFRFVHQRHDRPDLRHDQRPGHLPGAGLHPQRRGHRHLPGGFRRGCVHLRSLLSLPNLCIQRAGGQLLHVPDQRGRSFHLLQRRPAARRVATRSWPRRDFWHPPRSGTLQLDHRSVERPGQRHTRPGPLRQPEQHSDYGAHLCDARGHRSQPRLGGRNRRLSLRHNAQRRCQQLRHFVQAHARRGLPSPAPLQHRGRLRRSADARRRRQSLRRPAR